MISKILCTLWAPLFLSSAFAEGQVEEKLEHRFFGIPPGSVSVYKLKFETENSAISNISKRDLATVTVVRTGGGRAPSREAVICFEHVPAEFLWHPVNFVQLGKDGNLDQRMKDQHLSGMVWWWVLFGEVAGPAFSPGTKWARTETVPALWFLKDLPIEHTIETAVAEPGALRLLSRLDPERDTDKHSDVGSWKRQLMLDVASGRPRSISIFSEGDIRDLSDSPTHHTMRIELEEMRHRALSEDELALFPKSVKDLKPVVEAFESPSHGAGILSALFGKKPASPTPLLNAFEESHPKSPLLAVGKPLREWADRQKARDDEAKDVLARNEAEAAKLLNQPAPDFTLRDLDGKDVSLSSFRGKVVLLVFWHFM